MKLWIVKDIQNYLDMAHIANDLFK